MPSIAEGHSRACVNRCRSRMRSRDGFRFGPALGALSLTALRACFRVVRSYRALDPRPRPSPCFAIFTRNIDRRFCGSGSRPTTSATTIRRADTLTSLRFSRARYAAFRSPHRTRPHFRHSFLWEQCSSPLEEESRELRAATALPNRPYDAAKRRKAPHESHRPITTPLAGGAPTRPSLAAMNVGR